MTCDAVEVSSGFFTLEEEDNMSRFSLFKEGYAFKIRNNSSGFYVFESQASL